MNENVLWVVPTICFAGAYLSTVTGMGGGVVILAGCSWVMPAKAAVPLNAMLVAASLLARAVQYRTYISWGIARPFVVGATLGAGAGTLAYAWLSETALAIGLAAALLWISWAPKPARRRGVEALPLGYVTVGFAHTVLSTVTGVGGLMQAVVADSGLGRRAVVATLAFCVLVMSCFKIAGYAAAGFDYAAYLDVVALAWAGGLLGTFAGGRALERVSDATFRNLSRGVVTLFALRLLWRVVAAH